MYRTSYTPTVLTESPLYSLEKVTEELVRTSEGRRRYFDFLTHHENIEPIYKLYGLNGASESKPTLKSCSKHVKKLCLHIHPDRYPTEEYIKELFQMVWGAKEQYENSISVPPAFLGCLGHSLVITTLIKKNKWCQAKLLLTSKLQVGNTALDIQATAICLQLGDFQAAIKYIPPELIKIKAVLEECQEQLSIDLIESRVDERIDQLTLLLRKLEKLTEMYMSENLPSWPTPGFFDHVIPHQLFVLLKECFKLKNDPLMYEKYLRESIRYCPDGIQSDTFHCEKKKLINELEMHLVQYYLPEKLLDFSFIHEEMMRLAPLACQKLISDFQNPPLDEVPNQERITFLVSNFCSNGDAKYLDELILALDNLSKQPVVSSVVSFFNTLIPALGQKMDNYLAYSPQTKEMLNLWISRLSGWSYYLKNDKANAAHYFLKGRDYMSLGCTLAERYDFAEALKYWNMIPEESAQHIFSVMNYCDTLSLSESADFQREWLSSINDVQLDILRSFKK